MAQNTKHLEAVIAEADAGRISKALLLQIFQESIDNGDILEVDNEFSVVACITPLVDQGLLKRSPHFDVFERRMNEKMMERLKELRTQKPKKSGCGAVLVLVAVTLAMVASMT